MKSTWNNTPISHRNYKCSACGYEYNESYEFGVKIEDINNGMSKKPFMKLTDSVIYDTRYGYDGGIKQYQMYACPVCGTLQIDVG